MLVYSAPFRLALAVTVSDITASLKALRSSGLTISGSLEYQACDDEVCYLPASAPFRWTVKAR